MQNLSSLESTTQPPLPFSRQTRHLQKHQLRSPDAERVFRLTAGAKAKDPLVAEAFNECRPRLQKYLLQPPPLLLLLTLTKENFIFKRLPRKDRKIGSLSLSVYTSSGGGEILPSSFRRSLATCWSGCGGSIRVRTRLSREFRLYSGSSFWYSFSWLTDTDVNFS